MYSDYAIYIRNKDGSFRDRLIDVVSANIIETLNNIGSWTIKSRTPDRCPFMVGDGIVIYKDGDYYYSGPVGRISETYNGIDDIYEWTVQGVSDLDYLNRRVCYPDPETGHTSETAYYTDSGLLSEVVERLINKNMGILAMTSRKETLYDSVIAENVGSNCSVKLRFQTLLKAIQQQLDIQKFSINTLWNADTDKLSFVLRKSNDLSHMLLFSTELNSIDSYSFLASAPVGNYVISGGQGEQTERAFAYAENQESIGQWGRIEYFHDVRSVEAENLQNDADVTLQKSAEQNVGFSAEMNADGSYLRYRTDWNLGDYVGIVVHTGTPRTPTPPAGNSSTRIANTKFVKEAIDAVIPVGGFGALASHDTVNYNTEVTNKPDLGALASKDKVNYNTDINNTPTFGTLASKDTVNYETEVTNKPDLDISDDVLQVTSGGTGCSSEQELKDYILSLTEQKNPKVRYYVDGDQGSDQTGDGSSENPFKTIQKAIDTASPFVETTINVLQGAFGEILTIEEKNIQINMVERETPYYPGLWLIHNQSIRALDAAINVKNGTLRFYGNLRIDTIGDGIYIENGYVYLDGDPETDAIRINNTRTDNSGKRAVGVMKRSVFVCNALTLYAYFNESTGLQSNNTGISCQEWSYASVDSIQATYIDKLFFLYDSSLAYCGEATGSYLRYSVIEKTAFPNLDNFGTLAYKNSVNYETEVYNKPAAPEPQEYAPDFSVSNNYKIGDYVKYGDKLYRFIYDHNAGAWDTMDVTETHYSKELDTGEKAIVLSDSNNSSSVDAEIRGAGAHAITKVHLNYATPGSTTVSETVKTIVISGHKRVTVRATDGNKLTFNGLYGSQYHLTNKFYSIIVEDGAILELEGNITVTHSDSNGILIRRGGMVIYRSVNGSVLNISLPSENYHDGILVESGGKFIAEGNIVATRASTVYQQYPSHVINVSYGAEAHVKGITATNFNYCIGCTGGLASYESINGAGVFTASGGRVFTGAQ